MATRADRVPADVVGHDAHRLSLCRMIASSLLPLPVRLHVAIVDHGSDGVADELRVLLRDVSSVELVPAMAADETTAELSPRASWTPPEVVVIALGAAVELGMAMMSARRAVPDAA